MKKTCFLSGCFETKSLAQPATLVQKNYFHETISRLHLNNKHLQCQNLLAIFLKLDKRHVTNGQNKS